MGEQQEQMGARAVGTGLSQVEPAGGLAPSGFDPSRMDERIAEVMWTEFCPGVRLTDEDVRHYRRIARVILMRMREASWDTIQAAANIDLGVPRKDGFIGPVAASAAWRAMCTAAAMQPCDSDGSGEAGETGTGSTEGDSAGPQDIAHNKSGAPPHE